MKELMGDRFNLLPSHDTLNLLLLLHLFAIPKVLHLLRTAPYFDYQSWGLLLHHLLILSSIAMSLRGCKPLCL